MANCKNVNNFWRSEVKGQFDGNIIIHEEDDNNGNCRGRHSDGNRDVAGRCTGKVIWLFLPENNPEYIYVGEISGDNIHGHRMSLRGQNRERAEVLAQPDEWVAVKTVTVVDGGSPGAEGDDAQTGSGQEGYN